MYYTVYKITNLINNKIYIGVHKTEDINDNYMGSGDILKKSQKKYGIENFEKEILKVFNNAEDMFNMESEIVNEDFIKDLKNYNLALGGYGGDRAKFIDYEKVRKSHKANIDIFIESGRKGGLKLHTDEHKQNMSNAQNKRYMEGAEGAFKNKKHSKESKKQIGEANSKHQIGEGNSQFGTMWIHSLIYRKSKKIKKEELENYEILGWTKGRKMKF